VFTLEGAEHAYRVLIESMNEGALMLTGDKMILYANQCFARMVKCPLEQVMGGSFRRFLSSADRAKLRPLMKRADPSGSKIQVLLTSSDGSQIPAQISIRPQARNGSSRATIGMVVTDMTEARRNEEMLRALTHRVVEVQETERRRMAVELHDNITQLLCAILFRSQTLTEKLSLGDRPLKAEALKLCKMLGKAAEEVERISRNLRPSALGQLGLIAVLRDVGTEFADRTGLSVKVACVPLAARLPAEIELALYRILQKALDNVEKHAHARLVTVRLTKQGDIVQLAIKDDGVGFDPNRPPTRRQEKHDFGLLRMRERAIYLGGTVQIKSAPRTGTEIVVRIPIVGASREN
jgi:two-component system NarL family sensor kinase